MRVLSSSLPVLKPNLNLTWAQTRYLSRQAFSMSRIRVRLTGKLTHQKPSLIVGKAGGKQLEILFQGLCLVLRGWRSYRNRFIFRLCARSSAADMAGRSSSSSELLSSSSSSNPLWSWWLSCVFSFSELGVSRSVGLTGADPPYEAVACGRDPELLNWSPEKSLLGVGDVPELLDGVCGCPPFACFKGKGKLLFCRDKVPCSSIERPALSNDMSA